MRKVRKQDVTMYIKFHYFQGYIDIIFDDINISSASVMMGAVKVNSDSIVCREIKQK